MNKLKYLYKSLTEAKQLPALSMPAPSTLQSKQVSRRLRGKQIMKYDWEAEDV